MRRLKSVVIERGKSKPLTAVVTKVKKTMQSPLKTSEDLQARRLQQWKQRGYHPDAAKKARAALGPGQPMNMNDYLASITGHTLFNGLHRIVGKNQF